jgi:hypothetical protein
MFIKPVRTYYSEDGEQRTGKGLFLILMRDKNPPILHTNARAIVRRVQMRQLGNWMMGKIVVKGHTISLSGAYGANGLMVDVPTEVYEVGVDIPRKLYDEWGQGGGWNSCGNEAESLRKWVLENIKQLTKRE